MGGGIIVKISRANFIVITTTLFIILFLFQFVNLSTIYTSKATTNHYLETTDFIAKEQTVLPVHLKDKKTYSTAIIASSDDTSGSIASEWCLFTKRSYYCFDSLSTFRKDFSKSCNMLILGKNTVTTEADIFYLDSLCQKRIHLLFTSLPETTLIQKSPQLRRILGIKQVEKSDFKTSGTTIYEGFLLGGTTVYPKMKIRIPYFSLLSGTKTYMVGNIKKQKQNNIKNENLPPIIWRNGTQKNTVFCLNYDFFKDQTGLGLLTALTADMGSYALYPVVNAQSVVFQNLPYCANENSDTIKKRYYYDSKALCQNVIWPDIVSILEANNEKFSGMIAPKLDYKDSTPSDRNTLLFYFKQSEKISGELGLSGDQISDIKSYEKKLKLDTAFLQDVVPNYTFSAFSPGQMPESVYGAHLGNLGEKNILSHITTLIKNNDTTLASENLFYYYNSRVLALQTTGNGFRHTNFDDLRLKALETSLAFSCVSLDFRKVFYPHSKQDDWTKLSKNYSRYAKTYRNAFNKNFQQTTVSEASKKARRFLALNYSVKEAPDKIHLTIEHFNKEASFLLYLPNKKIASVDNASYTEIEKDRYLITASKDHVTINTKMQE